MSVRLIANVLDYVHGLPHGTKLVLLCLADNANDNDLAWPSFETLAKRCDMTRRHVIRVMAELEKTGLISRFEVRPYKPTKYRLSIPTSDTHVTSVAKVTSDAHDTIVVTPTSLGSDTHVTTSSDTHVTQTVSKPSIEPSIEPSGRARAKKATQVPDAFEVTEELYDWAWYQLTIPKQRVDAETDKFLDHFRANGKTMKDWTAAWKNWMRRSLEFGPRQHSNSRASPGRVSNYDQSAANIMGEVSDYGASGPVYETTGRIAG